MTKDNKPTDWENLSKHKKEIELARIQQWFDDDPHRFERFSISLGDILLDYSKNRITAETMNLLINLASNMGLKQKIAALFTGESINVTENRPALHTALRHPNTKVLKIDDRNIMQDIRDSLEQMQHFTHKIRHKIWRGVTGKAITTIVNIGIGGSHLGPLMAIHALAEFVSKNLSYHFISNIDSAHIHSVIEKINPETTIFIVSSKSFTTLETITNAHTLKLWLQNKLGKEAIAKHFIAITAAPKLALDFGIPKDNIFALWDWVGGRYSVWSAIGLPLAILIGMDNFLQFLQGAYEMDQHFYQADFSINMPVIMALLGIWYVNFFEATHHAIVPYSHRLNYLRMHLQQLDMESNGKTVSHEGRDIKYRTCPVIFGDQGCNGQHAFHQLLHQGPHLIPVDFLLVGKGETDFHQHHDILIASGLSQSQALMRGKTYTEIFQELKMTGLSNDVCEFLAKHKNIPGNRPSNTLFIKKINPHNLGALIALYEHKTFVQGVIWQINSFDQWGVELGKTLLPAILSSIISKNMSTNTITDSSTQGLIRFYKNSEAVTCE